MKKSLLFILLLFISLNSFAQKEVSDSLRVGNKAYKSQMYNAAESAYKAALSMNPLEKTAVYNLGNTYYKQGNWDEAIKQYENFISFEKEDIDKVSKAFHNMGNAYLKKKELEKSMDAYKNALRFNSTDNDARYNLAVVQKMIQDKKNKEKPEDKKQDQQQDKQDKQDKKDNKEQQQEEQKPKQQQEAQMSRENVEQILKAMEQEEKATQERVNAAKIEAQKERNATNKKQDKDW